MITCPVKVPVIVEFCPEANKATAKSVDKTPDLATAIKTPLLNIEVLFNASYKPKKELSVTAPDLKTATPMIKSKALTTKAKDNWMLESQAVKRTVWRMSSTLVWSSFRVCEMAECK